MSKVIVVDENDVETGLKSYGELQYSDIYRVTALWLTDLDNKYCLVTQRKWTKHNDPGKWMMAVSGTVEEGEDYDSNIAIEIEEEIGLAKVQTEKCDKILIDDGNHKFFVQYYNAQVDKDKAKIVIEEEKIENYKWILIEELLSWVKEKPSDFVPSINQSLRAVGVVS